MRPPDVTRALRTASALRSLCLALPHLPTPAEARRLTRFERLTASPAAAGRDDTEALCAGWRRWWRDGRVEDLRAMASATPRAIVDRDRWLASYATAARIATDPGGTPPSRPRDAQARLDAHHPPLETSP